MEGVLDTTVNIGTHPKCCTLQQLYGGNDEPILQCHP
jgi:hypothetical protein